MSSTASELNALAATTTIDIYKRNTTKKKSEKHLLKMSKIFTVMWGLIAICFASFGTLFENLIQLVNIIGSIFYGTILGIFIVAFFFKRITSNSVFYAACCSQLLILLIYINKHFYALDHHPLFLVGRPLLLFVAKGTDFAVSGIE